MNNFRLVTCAKNDVDIYWKEDQHEGHVRQENEGTEVWNLQKQKVLQN